MIRRTGYIYDLSTGLLTGTSFTSSDEGEFERQITEGHGMVFDVVDCQSQRVDLATGKLVDYQPARPSDDHYWEPRSKRWRLNPIVDQARQRRGEIIQRIKELDERLIRPMAELFENPDDTAAREIYSKLKAEKDTLRAELQGLPGTK